MATASMVLGIIGFLLIGLNPSIGLFLVMIGAPLGIVHLDRVRASGEKKGKGKAIAGLVLSVLILLCYVGKYYA